MKVLITGIASAFARLVTERLIAAGHRVAGIDRRPWPDPPKGVEIHRVDIRKRPAEDVFRRFRPEAVIHMATVTHLSTRREERYRINLMGTRSVFEHCARYGVKRAVFVSRHTIYGAAPDAPLYRTETEPPLAASTFPELADLVAADLYAASALWQYPDLATCVLRLVYTLGPSRRGTLASFLSGARAPMILGYDPLFQFMHEHDAADAIGLALEEQLRGVFNVAGPRPIPLSVLCRVTGRPAVPVPASLFPSVLGRFGFPHLTPAVGHHVKYPVVVDGGSFAKASGFRADYDEVQAMEAFRYA